MFSFSKEKAALFFPTDTERSFGTIQQSDRRCIIVTKQEISAKALELGFVDIGFATAEPFESQRKVLKERAEDYGFLIKAARLMEGTDPKTVYPEAKSIIVLLNNYFAQAFPPELEAHFGRCYQDDDRVTKDNMHVQMKAFRSFLRDNGIGSKGAANLPHRMSAARAGVASFGKNNFLYANRSNANSSWVIPYVLLVDAEFEPDTPTEEVTCPTWCKNACIAACPTGAIKGPRRLNPQKCISFLTYFAREITPMEMREQMGTWVYGCDRCQNVCPRNTAWLSRNLPANPRAAAKAADFELPKLLHMDKAYFEKRIWPHMFYLNSDKLWLWKMNVARAMGNTLDRKYVPELVRAFGENSDERVLGMIAWSLGRLGGDAAKQALEAFAAQSNGAVRQEAEQALERLMAA